MEKIVKTYDSFLNEKKEEKVNETSPEMQDFMMMLPSLLPILGVTLYHKVKDKVEDYKKKKGDKKNETRIPLAGFVPPKAAELAALLKKKWQRDIDVDGNLYIDDIKSGLQIIWNNDEDWGPVGFQIADEDGKELYIGDDPQAAKKAIDKYRK